MSVVKPRRTGLRLAQAGWALILVATVILVVGSLPARFDQLNRVAPDLVALSGALGPREAQALAQAGISLTFYAAYFTVLEGLSAFGGILVGAIIFWKRRDNWMAMLVSVALITLGASLTPLVNSVAGLSRAASILVTLVQFIGVGPSMLVFFLFPDGKFVPSWVRWIALVWMAYSIAWLFVPAWKPPFSLLLIPAIPGFVFLLFMTVIVTGVYSQFHRYRHRSSPLERQQTKWILFGFGLTLSLIFVVGVAFYFIDFDFPNPGTMIFLMAVFTVVLLDLMVLPIAVMLSILRYRLWDIDVLLRRTLVYGVLSALLALVYFSTIVFIQIFVYGAGTAGSDSQPAIVVSTLATALLFRPLRGRVQGFIDRRFFRRKYSAERALAAFAAIAREQVQFDRLAGVLLDTVEETMQPTHVSLWVARETRGMIQQRKP